MTRNNQFRKKSAKKKKKDRGCRTTLTEGQKDGLATQSGWLTTLLHQEGSATKGRKGKKVQKLSRRNGPGRRIVENA